MPEIKWLFNSKPLRPFSELKESETKRKSWMYFDAVSTANAGLYTCQVDGKMARVFHVMLDRQPQFLTSSRNFTVAENESVEFVCSVVQRMERRSKLVWKRSDENALIEASEVYEIADRCTSILKIDKVNRNHMGVYECFLEDKPHYLVSYGLVVRCM